MKAILIIIKKITQINSFIVTKKIKIIIKKDFVTKLNLLKNME